MTSREDVKRRYQRFAEMECKGHSELYYRLALAVSEDDEMIDFIAPMPVIQPQLLFNSVQLLTGPDAMPTTGAGLRALLRVRGGEVAAAMRSHRTQTNEVGRCAVLLLALPTGPLALVEVGASAGLCLLLDRFRYELGAARIGDPGSPVRLRCAVTGPAPLPSRLPHIVWRQGLDLYPIDVHDEAATRWLLACVWADHPERRRRLQAALDLARAAPPVVRAGDLVHDLPAVLAEAPDDAQLVVFHSAVLSYVTPERRRAFADVLAAASKRRDIVWLSNEAVGIVHDLTASGPAPRVLRFLLSRTHFTQGRRRDEILAQSHPHGGEVQWL